MRNSIAVRLVIGAGLLLGLFIVTTALSFWQTRLVDGKTRDVTEVQEPSRAAAYEMQLTATATGAGVLWFGAPVTNNTAKRLSIIRQASNSLEPSTTA